MEFLKALLKVSEKAANVARIIRKEEHLFQLLVQEKGVLEKNPRFQVDFKTLADVLIQEMVRHDLGKQFPEIKDRIKGEESNVFCNKLDEKIIVEIKETVEDTSKLLEIVLNGEKEAAILLAHEVHKSVSLEDVDTEIYDEDFILNIDKIGIWIDPIDSTAEYINAVSKAKNEVSISGLNCVTILIGAYNLETGDPIIGVVNQPFLNFVENRWHGKCYWGVCNNSTRISSLNSSNVRCNKACLSTSEDEDLKLKLKNKGFELIEAAGAGYKILTVIKGQADFYVLSKNSTFKWDTCAPQAILKSFGGDIVNYDKALNNELISLKYANDENYCNEGGLIAFRDVTILQDFI